MSRPCWNRHACVCSLVTSALQRTLMMLALNYHRFPAGCCHALTGGSAALRLFCMSGPLKLAPLCQIQCSSSVHIDRSFVSYLQPFLRHSCDAHSPDKFLDHLLVKVFIAGCYVLLWKIGFEMNSMCSKDFQGNHVYSGLKEKWEHIKLITNEYCIFRVILYKTYSSQHYVVFIPSVLCLQRMLM